MWGFEGHRSVPFLFARKYEMRIQDIKPLQEEKEPFVVRLLRRALTKQSNVLIDATVKSGRKHGFLTDIEVGTGWKDGLGNKIPTYRFVYHRAGNAGRGTFELPAEGVDDILTLTKEDGEIKVIHIDKINEMEVAGKPPLWFTLMQKGLAAGKKFYFASGANKIYDVRPSGTGYRLLMTNRKTGEGKNYTMVADNAENWTLTKFEDGHRLTMIQNVKKPVTEAVEDPAVYSMFQKLLADGQKVFFRNRSGKKTQLRHAMAGVSTSGKPAWWFFDSDNSAHRKAIVWKVGETIDKLTLKKDGDDWMLFDKTVKLKEERGDEPTVITLINKRIALQGAVNVDIIQNGKQVRGWITEPIVPSPFSTPEHFYYKTILHKMTGNSRAFILGTDADALFRVTQQKEKNGKTTLKLVSREGAQDASK